VNFLAQGGSLFVAKSRRSLLPIFSDLLSERAQFSEQNFGIGHAEPDDILIEWFVVRQLSSS